jgi:hypothetical protein
LQGNRTLDILNVAYSRGEGVFAFPPGIQPGVLSSRLETVYIKDVEEDRESSAKVPYISLSLSLCFKIKLIYV